MIEIFLTGDVMSGRGVDQVLAHACPPGLHESWVKDAREYVSLAESESGPIPRPVPAAYPWGVALEKLEQRKPDVRIVNLETSLTLSEDYWPGKGIHYRMHPANVTLLTEARVDCCVLANNHVLDWGYAGLEDTLATLERANLRHAGAGRDQAAAAAPAIVDLGAETRILVFAYGDESSGIPDEWSAGAGEPGVALLSDTSAETARKIGARIGDLKQAGDLVVVSIHWGANWGYAIDPQHRRFAHALIDSGAVDIVHGHSSHHPKGLEVYREKPIIYGCGDLINDYEGIGGHEAYRSELAAMYFVRFERDTGRLIAIDVVPARLERFKLRAPGRNDAAWLRSMFEREGQALGTRAELNDDTISIYW